MPRLWRGHRELPVAHVRDRALLLPDLYSNRDADLSDFVEITFSVAKDVRESSNHDPWSLSPDDYFFGYRFTGNGFMSDGAPIGSISVNGEWYPRSWSRVRHGR